MTPAQVIAEFADPDDLPDAPDAAAERRIRRIRDILQTVCFQQGIAARYLPTVPVTELARHVAAICGGTIDAERLRSAVEAFAIGA